MKQTSKNYSINEAMLLAVQIAKAGQTVFAAVILDESNQLIASAANTGSVDGPTAHAEMNVLKAATIKGHLPKGYTLITTCEPCPMCMGAAIWSRVDTIYYGVSIELASKYMNQIMLSSEKIAAQSFHKPRIVPGCCTEECMALFEKKYEKKI